MNEVYGLIDALEATILESQKIPFTDKVMMNERPVLEIIDKIRLAMKSNGSIVYQSINTASAASVSDETQVDERSYQERSYKESDLLKETHRSYPHVDPDLNQVSEAVEEAEKIKVGAKEYADFVLANLQLTITKLQKNIAKMERNIENGREVLGQQKSGESDTGTTATTQTKKEPIYEEN